MTYTTAIIIGQIAGFAISTAIILLLYLFLFHEKGQDNEKTDYYSPYKYTLFVEPVEFGQCPINKKYNLVYINNLNLEYISDTDHLDEHITHVGTFSWLRNEERKEPIVINPHMPIYGYEEWETRDGLSVLEVLVSLD